MAAEPETPLTAAMLARAGDLAAYMLQRGVDAAVASGTTPNGQPCTVIMAIGWTAETARTIGEALVRVSPPRRTRLSLLPNAGSDGEQDS